MKQHKTAIANTIAKRSIKADNKKMLFCIITIAVAVATMTFALLTVQNIMHQKKAEAARLNQGLFFNVPRASVEIIGQEESVEKVGFGTYIEAIPMGEHDVVLTYFDDNMFRLFADFNGEQPKAKNEIVVSDSFLSANGLPEDLGTNITLTIDGADASYIVSGIYHDASKSASNFPVIVSWEKYVELSGTELANAYVWLTDADSLTEEEAKETLQSISENTGYSNWSVTSYYDTVLGGLGSSFLLYAAVAGILFFAAAIVIYSIFYISIGHKVEQYGQLRTIGATKKQIYKVVQREGMAYALFGIPIGFVIGAGVSVALHPTGWTITAVLSTFCLAAVFALLILYISIRKPAKLAASVSPIAAITNQALSPVQYRKHKTHRVSVAYLAKINYFRNKKKTMLTVASLALCGTMFFLAASYQNSFNAESMARYRDFKFGDFKIAVNLEDSTADTDSILQKGYFDTYAAAISEMEGVQNIYTHYALPTTFSIGGQSISDSSMIMGYGEKDLENLRDALITGSIDESTELVISDVDRFNDVYHWTPGLGDKITFQYKTGTDETVSKEVSIGAVTSNADGLNGYFFRMPDEVLTALAGYECIYAIEIQEESDMYEPVENELTNLVAGNADVELETLQENVAMHQSENAPGFFLAYAITIILGVFAIINLINLTITNLLDRKREIGVLRSIGMTGRQLGTTYLIEGLVTIGISVFVALILGIPGGYVIGMFLAKGGMSNGFVFPVVAFLSFLAIIVFFECAITLISINYFKKETIIESIKSN